MNMAFYKNRKILITGHNGFKGTWMCKLLVNAGAQVTGYALTPVKGSDLFQICNLSNKVHSIIGDVRDLNHLKQVFSEIEPEIVIHMAAQPIVRDSYKDPVYTYDVNVMGTVNIMECLRLSQSVKSFVNVTTDKVYLNKEWEWGYRENDELNGYDPYSNSKSCSELVTSSYKNSFFKNRDIAISTVRAGNVIGGGDFANDRIIPDCMRAIDEGRDIIIRNPYSTRPYQHVLDPVTAYLLIAQAQYENKELSGNFNVGPDDVDCYTTGKLVNLFCYKWKQLVGNNVTWKNVYDGEFHEANFLKLDCSKLKKTLGWQPRWTIEIAMEKVVEWIKIYFEGGDVSACMDKQIQEFLL